MLKVCLLMGSSILLLQCLWLDLVYQTLVVVSETEVRWVLHPELDVCGEQLLTDIIEVPQMLQDILGCLAECQS